MALEGCDPHRRRLGDPRMPRTKYWNNSAHWRNRAGEMRTLAERTFDPRAKKRMLKMAEEYEILARRAEERTAYLSYQDESRLGGIKKMPRIPDADEFHAGLTRLPVLTVHPGEMVLTAGSSTGRLLVLKKGAVEILRDGVQLARVSDTGAVFGELAALLNKPHTADVRALEQSELSIADAATLLNDSPTTLLYVAALLAQRLDSANTALLEVKRQLRASKSNIEIGALVADLEDMFSTI